MKDLGDVEAVRQAVEAGRKLSYLFFWGHRARAGVAVGKWCLSQWWPAPCTVDGVTYATAEHFMMCEKARLFGDREAEAAVLACDDPAQAKKAGRGVRGFEARTWDEQRFDRVLRGNRAKFAQHAALGAYLAGRPEDVIVEASPVDAVWGIGLAETDAAARDPRRWPGLNLLGFALMEVRGWLRAGAP